MFNLSFIGRDDDLDRLCGLLIQKDVRLVTVVGPGGIGKTRTAVEAAQKVVSNFAEGVSYIDFSSVTGVYDPYTILAQRMGLHIDSDQEARIFHYLHERSILFIFDNIEQIDHCEKLVADLLSHTTDIKILVASQKALNLKIEWLQQLQGFSLPSDSDFDIEHNSAIRLFVARATQIRSDFSLHDHLQAIIEICKLIDGIPLAIELAAVWVKTLPCEAIANQIKISVDFLATRDHDMDYRHRSMRAVFDYSWQFLSDEEKRILRRLSVFRGRFSFEAAQHVALVTPHILADLVDKSLLSQSSDDSYRMHELLRHYVEEQVIFTDIDNVSTRSAMMITWLNLMRGDIAKAEDAAKTVFDRHLDDKGVYEETFELALLGLLAGIRENYDQGLQLCEASLNLIYQNVAVPDPVTTIFAHIGMSIMASGRQDYLSVRQHVTIALREAINMKMTVFKLICFPIAAILMTHQVEFEYATELLAQAFSYSAAPGWMNEWPLLIQLREDLQNELGKNQYEILWEHGKLSDVDSVADTLLKTLVADT